MLSELENKIFDLLVKAGAMTHKTIEISLFEDESLIWPALQSLIKRHLIIQDCQWFGDSRQYFYRVSTPEELVRLSAAN